MMATRDDVTVRLDTELRAKASPEGLNINMSRLFEDALREEIRRLETIQETLSDGLEDVRLDLEDADGRGYVGRFRGKRLGETDHVEVFLAEDERLIVYDLDKRDWCDLAQSETSIYDWLPDDSGVLAEVLHALGETPEIDI